MAIFKKKQKFMTEEDYLKLEHRIEILEDNYWELFNMAERYLNECSEQADFRNYASEKIIDLSNQVMDLEDALKGQKQRLNLLESYYEDVIKEQKQRLNLLENYFEDVIKGYVGNGENETEETCDE